MRSSPNGPTCFAEHIKNGVVLTTHYSGVGTAEDAAHFAIREVILQSGDCLGQQARSCMDNSFECYASSDRDELCRKVLLGAGMGKHVFGDILDRVPEQVLLKLRTRLQGFVRRLQSKVAADTSANRGEIKAALVKSLGSQWCKAAHKIWWKCVLIATCGRTASDANNSVCASHHRIAWLGPFM